MDLWRNRHLQNDFINTLCEIESRTSDRVGARGAHHGLGGRYNIYLNRLMWREYGTYKTVTARFWPCPSGKSPETPDICSMLAPRWD